MKEKVTRKSYYCTTFLNYIRPLLNGNLWALACPNWPRWRRLTSPATASVLSSQSSQIKTNKNKKKFRVIKPLLLPAWVLFPHDLIIIIKTHPSSIRSLYKQAEERPLSVPIYTPHSILHMHFIWPLSFPPTVTCTLHTAHCTHLQLKYLAKREPERKRDKIKMGMSLPGWLGGLVEETFFVGCESHDSRRKNEKNIFCLDCCTSICPHCAPLHPHHPLLQVILLYFTFLEHFIFFILSMHASCYVRSLTVQIHAIRLSKF